MITFRPYQRECIDSFYRYYDTGNAGHGLIVVPTAGGKSLIIGGLTTEIYQKWPGQRILVLSHVRELILQNYEKIMACWSKAPAGIYSAALGRREAHKDIVAATVQSVYRKAHELGHRDLCFIDEAHLLQFGNLGMYGKLIEDLLKINPCMKICGFTATDYRLDAGRLTEGDAALFDDVIIEITIRDLLAEGYLTPPISKSSLVQADLEGVKKIGGEFNIKQMAERFDQKEFINAAMDTDLPFLEDRRSIALFCATLKNAAHVAEAMTTRGIYCEVIDGEMSGEDREDILERFRSGQLRALASIGVITTGTDIPNMDAIVLFRATESPGLYQQIVGRGFRVMYADGYDIATRQGRLDAIRNGQKPNFLTLDHGGNIERHGAITHVQKPVKKEKGERKKSVKLTVRICEICRSAWPLEILICGTCQNPLKVERNPTDKLSIEASDADIMGSAFLRGEVAKWFDVEDVRYALHNKRDGFTSVKITYYCGIMQFNEWIRVDLMRGKSWWKDRTNGLIEMPKTPEEALLKLRSFNQPSRIQVIKKDFYEVIKHEYQYGGVIEHVHTTPEKSLNIDA